MKRRLSIAALWVLVLLGGVGLSYAHQNLGVEKPGTRRQGDILLDVFGEFRTVMARYLWFKMDLFHEVLDDEGIRDTQQAEILPLLRMISLLDPSMTDAYDNIAWDLFKGHRQAGQALAILDEGLQQNEQSFQLHFRRSLICYQDGQFEQALASAKAAASCAKEEMDLLNGNRMLYWSAKKLHDRAAMLQALDRIQALRPQEKQWAFERAALEASQR